MTDSKTTYRVGDTRVKYDPAGLDMTVPGRGDRPERTFRNTCSWGYKAPSGKWQHCGAPAKWQYATTKRIDLEFIGIGGFRLMDYRCDQHPKDLSA